MSVSVNEITPPIHTRLFDIVDWREFACGWGSAIANISITYPINKIIFRQVNTMLVILVSFCIVICCFKMIHGVKVKKAILQLHGEGIFYLYRGILPPLCQKTLAMSVMFGMYGASYNYLTSNAEINVYIAKVISGLVSGSLEAILTPFERIQTLLQHREYHEKFKNSAHAFKDLRYYGIKEYYRGIEPILLRNGPSNVCFFIVRDEVKLILPVYDSMWKSTFVNFLSGATIGVCISAIFYPLNVVKVHMQEQLGGKTRKTWAVLASVYRERGCKLKHIYRGLGTNSTRAFCSWGVICAAYEQLKILLY